MRYAANRLVSVAGAGERTPDGVIIIRKLDTLTIDERDGGSLRSFDPSEDDVRQALTIMRWQEKQGEWFYDDRLDAFMDAIQNRKYK